MATFSAPPHSAVRRRVQRAVELWHLLSLDAPSIAALWAWALARELEVHPQAAALGVLTLGTWLVYVADRLLDSHLKRTYLRERHTFHGKHWRAFTAAAIVVASVLTFLVIQWLPKNAFIAYTLLLALTIAYLGMVHLGRRISAPHCMVVAGLFALSTSVPAAVQIQNIWQGTPLLMSVTSLAVVAWLNCWAIEMWETGRRAHLRATVAKRSFWIAFVLALVAFASGDPVVGIAALSALLLFVLDGKRAQISPLMTRVAADAALLTPLLLMLFRFLHSQL